MSQELKTQLLARITSLGKDRALFPFADPEIERKIKELENLNPISQPLQVSNRDSLIGDWELVYASNGTVITRPISELTTVLGSGIKINRIWQSLNIKDGIITASNQALIELLFFGEYQIGVKGTWQPETDLQTAKVIFDEFNARVMKLFNRSDWMLPKLEIPVLDFLQNSAFWLTSYLDEDTRIGRGKTGNLFIFHRQKNILN